MLRKRQEYKVYPQDTKPNTGIGIKFPFNTSKVFDINYTTKDQIKSNLMIFMLTNKGERIFNPDFGADIRGHLFEQMDSIEDLKESILNGVYLYFPQISVEDLSFIKNDEDNSFFITLNYVFNKEMDNLILQLNR